MPRLYSKLSALDPTHARVMLDTMSMLSTPESNDMMLNLYADQRANGSCFCDVTLSESLRNYALVSLAFTTKPSATVIQRYTGFAHSTDCTTWL